MGSQGTELKDEFLFWIFTTQPTHWSYNPCRWPHVRQRYPISAPVFMISFTDSLEIHGMLQLMKWSSETAHKVIPSQSAAFCSSAHKNEVLGRKLHFRFTKWKISRVVQAKLPCWCRRWNSLLYTSKEHKQVLSKRNQENIKPRYWKGKTTEWQTSSKELAKNNVIDITMYATEDKSSGTKSHTRKWSKQQHPLYMICFITKQVSPKLLITLYCSVWEHMVVHCEASWKRR